MVSGLGPYEGLGVFVGDVQVAVDGTIKGVGRIYQQTFIDTYSRVAMAKLYTEKTAITAADLLSDRVVPFFDEQGIPLVRILTDRGTEYCGKPEPHRGARKPASTRDEQDDSARA